MVGLRQAGRLRRVGRARRALPENVRALGWVSFANDFASELVYPVLPLFLTVTLGAPVAILGLIEGIAEGVAVGLRGVAGWLSDRVGERRRPWIVTGYALSALARPVIAAAPAWGWVLGGRLGDRLGAFLLILPFSQGFPKVSEYQRGVFFAAVLSSTSA